jgi:hypothetical protein
MILEFSRITSLPMMRKRDKAVNTISNSEAVIPVQDVIQSEGYLLKLIF